MTTVDNTVNNNTVDNTVNNNTVDNTVNNNTVDNTVNIRHVTVPVLQSRNLLFLSNSPVAMNNLSLFSQVPNPECHNDKH